MAPYSVYGYPAGSLWEKTDYGYVSEDGRHSMPKEIVEGWEKIRK